MTVLKQAHDVIYGEREQTYGDPGKNLRVVANFWENYLAARGHWDRDSEGLTSEDVCHMMSLLKIARLTNTPSHHDSLVDLCGYTALVERINKHAGSQGEETPRPESA